VPHVITDIETLNSDFKTRREAGIKPELETLGRSITFFGPVPPELVAHVSDHRWGYILMKLSEATADNPSMRFNQWKEEVFPNLNNCERAIMPEILKDPWWSRDEKVGSQ
jgi:hypothetical protein